MPSVKPSPTPADAADRLERILERLIAAHESLLALTGEHRAAIARADGAATQECARRQAELAQQIGKLETERRALVTALVPTAPVPPAKPLSLAALAALFPEPVRARITAFAARLRELLLRVQEENRVIRTATHALIAHMDGLMQQVAKALSHAGVYGPKGRMDQPPAVTPAACGLDLLT